MNQDERRAKLALEGGEVRQALERAGFSLGVVDAVVHWAEVGLHYPGVQH